MIAEKGWKSLLYLGLAAVLFATPACDKDDDDEPDTEYSLSGNATGAQEVPTVTTAATGTLTGNYNSSTNMLTYNISWTGLSEAPTMMHFHGPAVAGTNASPVVNITDFTAAAAGSASGSATLTEAQEADLLNGLWYYNIHTPSHGGGEIRAQVVVQ